MASSASTSASFFGFGDDELHNLLKPELLPPAPPPTLPQNPSLAAAIQPAAASAPVKKRRNLPGVTVPDAEVIALSPRSLLTTNRFICEVCNKGFQREQNLQLHRRGHNLPWKLRQKSTKEVRRRMYLCPEPTCVHHDPSRALGDLTGIKKHFSRKHGEKKWKCEKCSKRYAVQSDLKAHSKTCGTREYRCDCGTLFSRRDSFITHRAFCDTLAQENARLPTVLPSFRSHLFGSNNMALNLSQVNSHLKSLQDQTQPSPNLLRLGGRSQFDQLLSTQNASAFRAPASSFYFNEDPQSQHNFLQSRPNFHGLMQLPNLQSNAAGSSPTSANLFSLNFLSNSSNASDMTNTSMTDQYSNVTGRTDANNLFSNILMSDHIGGVNSIYNSSMQNDSMLPEMSATALLQKADQIGSKGAITDFQDGFGGSGINEEFGFRAQMENEIQLQSLMNSLANGNSAGCFNNAFSSSGLSNMDGAKFGLLNNANLGVSDRLTRDFLGVGSMVRSINGGMSEQHHHPIELNPLDQDIKFTIDRSFAGGGSM